MVPAIVEVVPVKWPAEGRKKASPEAPILTKSTGKEDGPSKGKFNFPKGVKLQGLPKVCSVLPFVLMANGDEVCAERPRKKEREFQKAPKAAEAKVQVSDRCVEVIREDKGVRAERNNNEKVVIDMRNHDKVVSAPPLGPGIV